MVKSVHKFAGIELGVSDNPVGISGMFYRLWDSETWHSLSEYSDLLIQKALIEIIKLAVELEKKG